MSEFSTLCPEPLKDSHAMVSLLPSPIIFCKAHLILFQLARTFILTGLRASLYVDLANQIRSGSTDQIPQYDELLYISNSYGSVLGVYISQTYPNLFNISVFTGYTKRILPSYYGIALQNPQPANVLFPEKFPNTHYPLYVRTNFLPLLYSMVRCPFQSTLEYMY